MLTKKNLVT